MVWESGELSVVGGVGCPHEVIMLGIKLSRSRKGERIEMEMGRGRGRDNFRRGMGLTRLVAGACV